jgi:histone chaperone ASF1
MVRSLVSFVYKVNPLLTLSLTRDSDDSAPAEYPPDQPEADGLEDDSGAYGAEERELEAALLKELEESNKPADGEDHEMEGAEAPAGKEDEDEDEVSDAESEDLEAESDDDEEDLDEEEGGDGDEDVEMGDDAEKDESSAKPAHPAQPEVMVH